MAEFDDIRRELRKARGDLEEAADAVAAERERAARGAGEEDALDERRKAHRAAIDAERALRERFAAFSDPREGIAKLDDSMPILLMPVRLETRFKGPELWVRVYPDDCWIDGFDPTLTESEVVDARAYWIGIWQAGGVTDQERGAWRVLAGAHGSGRAAWIVEQFQPAADPPRPVKPNPEDVVLTIPLDARLAPAEEAAAATYWRAAWLADGDATKTAQARQALVAAVGAQRAAEIVAGHRPANFDSPVADKQAVGVQVAFLVLGSVETKRAPWARAPRLRFLPDRFVFIGYRGEEPPLVQVGAPVAATLFVGPDPTAPESEQLRHDANGNLIVPEELLWLSDFPSAVDAGMAFRIPLNAEQARGGFDRVLVTGVRLSADEAGGQDELETLLRHHAASRKGLAVIPQGTPTNNTEELGAGHSRLDDPDESFDDLAAPLFTEQSAWLDKRDGQWLAEYLGVDPALFAHVHGAGTTDQIAARSLSAALWPATLGYWMETMMAPVFPREAVDQTRDFFTRFVVGAGAVPAIRIGSQPYGILPATALSRPAWLDRGGVDFARLPSAAGLPYLSRLHQVLTAIRRDWAALDAGAFVGKPGDPHALLLDIVGLHSGSVEWSQRRAESLRTLYNRLALQGFGGLIVALLVAFERQRARDLLTGLGYGGEPVPPILELIFSGSHNALGGGVVDDRPLSEQEPIRDYTDDDRNYIRWLVDAAGTSLDALYRQDDFTGDRPPQALLYLMLRHALQLGYHDAGVRLHVDAGIYTAEQAVLARADDPFLHIRTSGQLSESKYQPLYAFEPAITGDPNVTVSQFIAANFGTLQPAFSLRDQLDALARLEHEPTGRLERAFADHVDTCAYRLDAWLLGIVHYQLALMRGLRDGGEGSAPRQGVHLGAYGWLEDLRPELRELEPVELTDPELIKDFGGDPPLTRDSANQGFIHAPSPNHAVAAAILRNGFLADASPENRQTMAVNLTSERVRGALAMLQGVRAGQGLGDLLGYQFERGLHDRHAVAEVDAFIYSLRRAFPLRADRLATTKAPAGEPIQAIEARNVIDGLALVEHMRTTGEHSYPFGRTDLRHADPGEAEQIDAEADRLLEIHDAVADLALSEGVFQAVLGNYDRVASTYDAYARGNFPPEPEIVRTPLPGIGLTHRVALHLEAGVSHTASPVGGVGMTPRAQGEPALNRWLAGVLPPLGDIACVVAFHPAGGGAPDEQEVTLRRLGLQPADVLAIVQLDPQGMSELDDRVLAAAIDDASPRPDARAEILYMQTRTAPYSIFEVTPLVRALRRLTSTSRPLTATDLRLVNEATAGQDAQPVVNEQRLVAVRAAMGTLRGELDAFRTTLATPVLADIDDYVARAAVLLGRTAAFAVPQSGWGFAFEAQRRIFAGIVAACDDLVARWEGRLDEFAARLAEETALPPAASDEERFRLLLEAERAISTTPTSPLPAQPGDLRNQLEMVTEPAFAARQAQFAAIRNTTRTEVGPLLGDVAALLPIDAFDATGFSLAGHEAAIAAFVRDAAAVVAAAIAELDRRLAESQTLLDDAGDAAEPGARLELLQRAARALLGDDFLIVPEFELEPATGDAVDAALTASRSGDLFAHLTDLDMPVDTWLYGLARVRPKLHDWEQTLMVAGALGRPEPALDAIQLPPVAGDRWLGLDLAPNQKLDTDKLLYAAHFAVPFDKTARQCGLLLDEWTETIPGDSADTGLAFHHDRPNTEAPQAMLLVTPADFRGAWRWDDLVDALHETFALAKLRAVEPVHVDALPYAPFLPATVMASQVWQLTIALDLALNNTLAMEG